LSVNGQKIWTTGAHHAHWMFALVRTDPEAADRRNGISMILIDMKSKGITVRPIRTISGEDEFAEVFFDNVEVPIENVVGKLNEGWKLANAVLETERITSGSPQKVIVLLDRVRRVAKATGASDDAAFRERLADAEIDVLAFQASFARMLDRVKAGGTPGTASSAMKLVNAELAQTLADILVEASGSLGAGLEPMLIGDRSVAVGTSYLQARRQTIYGGTSEIQRNIIAKRVLDLGNDPKR
jgi:alkylation response protein AidB-like acyl-CoA dehydrogenase